MSSHAFSQNNTAKTGKFVPPHKLEAAVVDQSTSCAAATYGSPTIPAVMAAEPYIDQSGSQFVNTRLCLRNVGRAAGRVSFYAGGTSETELTCEAEEVDPTLGNDTTCTTSESGVSGTGELASILDLSVFPDGSNPAGCGGGQLFAYSAVRAMPQTATPWRVLASSIAPGETCRYSWNAQVQGTATEQQRFLSQTDEVRWFFQFMLADIPTT